MPANASTITRHLPIITPRIEFVPSKHFGAPPVITPRIDFGTTTRLPPGDIETEIETEFGSSNNSDSDADADIVDDVLTGTLISKPIGQPGRPHSGGYKLDVVLVGWKPQLLNSVTKLVHDKADEILDTKRSYRCQKHDDLDMICELVESKHPILKKYKGCWPVRDILKLHLKYTSTRSNHPSHSAVRGRKHRSSS